MKRNIIFVSILFFFFLSAFSGINYFYQKTIKTEAKNLVLSDFSTSRAKLSYTICGEAITEIGVCYGTGSNPVASDKNTIIDYQGNAMDVPVNVDYRARINKLDQDKEYFVRAYVKNKAGKIFYSDEVSFKTEKDETDYQAMLNGPKRDFYPNGSIMKEYTLKDGQVEGNMKFYNEDGTLVANEYIKNGIQNGMCMYYHSNGQLKTRVELTNGVQNGQLTEYDADGVLTTDSNLTGTPPEFNGVVKHFFKNGQVNDVTYISGGKLSSSVHYDIEGRVTSEVTADGRTDYSYDSDGTKHTSINGEKCTCSKCSENSNN